MDKKLADLQQEKEAALIQRDAEWQQTLEAKVRLDRRKSTLARGSRWDCTPLPF